jgi:hypothetical protein
VIRLAKASLAESTTRRNSALDRLFRGLFIRDISLDPNGSSASSQGGRNMRVALGTACLAAAMLAAPVLSTTRASAAVVTDRPLLFSFDGSDTTQGSFTFPDDVEVDQATGNVYVFDRFGSNVTDRAIDKFDAAGVAQDFSGLGESSLSVPSASSSTARLAVDNSGANPGRIYTIQDNGGFLRAYAPTGLPLWQLSPPAAFNTSCAVAVDAAGHPWISDRVPPQRLREFDSSGSPPSQVGVIPYTSGGIFPCSIDFDSTGNAYIAVDEAGQGTHKYVGGVFDSTVDPLPSADVTVDKSAPAGHIFTAHDGSFNEYDSTGAPLGTFGANALSGTEGIAYNAALDRVYAVNSGVVSAFGPVASGTVPDATIEASTAVGVFKATFHGKVNPQSVPNSYFFEWKKGTGSSWAGAESSAPQALPEDSSEHAVQFETGSLRGDTTYQVRLVTENSTNGLRLWSGADTFTTAQATAAPAVTIGSVTGVGPGTATVPGTINPEGDTAEWKVQVSVDPTCAGGFADEAMQVLAPGSEVPVDVSYDLQGLLADEHYCVRIAAANSFGITTSAVEEFTTQAVVPTNVETTFVAPRHDTSAQLNGRVNPQGALLDYHFEYSKDSGGSWIPLSDQQEEGESREQIVVSQELTGLAPNTTYSYRFLAENAAGVASPQGAVRTFTTRGTAETTLPERGIELVNSPSKGNQHALPIGALDGTPPLSKDGNKAIWTVTAGAPGANAGAFASFLAERTAEGWRSRSLVPVADKQVGGGGFVYRLETATPDFANFISLAAKSDIFFLLPQTVVRLDPAANQEILTTFTELKTNEGTGISADMTADGEHVVAINSDTGQLEDIGDSTPEIISVMPSGSPAGCPVQAFMNNGLPGEAAGMNWRPGYHRIATNDASRVYFEVTPDGSCGIFHPEGLYVRNLDTEQTTLIDPGISASSEPEMIRATPDGRGAYFLTASKLDPADLNTNNDVYRWDEADTTSACLTCQVTSDANLGIGVGNEVVVSDDFSHIYFSSPQQLIPGKGAPGRANIYVLNEGELRFVADAVPVSEFGVLAGVDRSMLSSDGEELTFIANATRRLTSDEVAAKCIDPVSLAIESCLELYRYDDGDTSIECLSCDRGGLTTHSVGTPFHGTTPSDFKVSANGSTVAFATAERLVNTDVNNDTDIYEWRNGSLRLITDGVSDFQERLAAPQVAAVDADGENILFSIVAPGLTGFEQDGLANIYDARVGGGFEPSPAPVHCSEDSCQGPLQATPSQLPPSSSSFSGSGNVRPAPHRSRRPCARKRGKAKRRCAKKQKKHSRDARAQLNTRRAK